MVVLTFADSSMLRRALGFLAGRSFIRLIKTDRGFEVIVPEAALTPLAYENVSFTVQGRATYEQLVAPGGKWPRRQVAPKGRNRNGRNQVS